MEVLSCILLQCVTALCTTERTPPSSSIPKTPSDRDLCRSGIPAGPNVAMTWAAGATLLPFPQAPGVWCGGTFRGAPYQGHGAIQELSSCSPATSFFPSGIPCTRGRAGGG